MTSLSSRVLKRGRFEKHSDVLDLCTVQKERRISGVGVDGKVATVAAENNEERERGRREERTNNERTGTSTCKKRKEKDSCEGSGLNTSESS